jgi:hypothetical protein
MAAISGRKSEIWTQTGSTSALTKTACEAVGGSTTIFHVTDAAKRYLDPATAILVYCGAGETLQTSGYHIAGGCQIHFDAAPTAPVKLTGAYFSMAEVTLCQSWDASIESTVFEITSLGDTTAKFQGSNYTAWSGSIARFYEDNTWGAKAQANTTQHIVRLFTDQPAGFCWTGWATITSWSDSVPVEDLQKETISFTGISELVYSVDET